MRCAICYAGNDGELRYEINTKVVARERGWSGKRLRRRMFVDPRFRRDDIAAAAYQMPYVRP